VQDDCCMSCHVGNGAPRMDGCGWGYYASRGGEQMLVVERGAGQRIRINGAIEVVVLETSNGAVRLRIDDVGSAEGDSPIFADFAAKIGTVPVNG
jgi:hypothetical protein